MAVRLCKKCHHDPVALGIGAYCEACLDYGMDRAGLILDVHEVIDFYGVQEA